MTSSISSALAQKEIDEEHFRAEEGEILVLEPEQKLKP
ncbi:unnamed protein product, partial [marine sediment metagenome]